MVFENQLRFDTPFTIQVVGVRKPATMYGIRWAIYDGVEKKTWVCYLGQTLKSIERFTIVTGKKISLFELNKSTSLVTQWYVTGYDTPKPILWIVNASITNIDESVARENSAQLHLGRHFLNLL